MSTQTATREHGAIESAQMERVDGGAGDKLYDIRVGGKRVGSVGTYLSAKQRGTGTVTRWFAANPAGVRVQATSRNNGIVLTLVALGFDQADAELVAPRIALL